MAKAPSPPQVSVVIPTRDRAGRVAEAARSALGQEGVNLEVIVVDDASPNSTAAAVRDIEDARLHYLHQDTRKGVAAARNKGLSHASADWVAFLDDDDLWHPAKLRHQLAAAGRTGADWVWTAATIVDADHSPTHMQEAPDPGAVRDQLRSGNAVPAGASSVLARAERLRRLGGFDESLSHLADWDMWIRLADSAAGAACDESLVEQVLHRGGMHAAATAEALAEFDRLRSKHPDISARHFMRWIVSAHLRGGRRWPAVRDWLVGRWRYRHHWDS